MNKIKKKDKYFYFSMVASLTTREAALAMLGFDYYTEDRDLEYEQLEEVNKLKKVITRNLQKIVDRAASNITYPSHWILCAAYSFMDEYTPGEVRETINKAVVEMTNEKGWEKSLKKLGGDELYELGKRIRHHKRGLHKRDDEDRNNCKLIALLVELLQKHGKPNYKDMINIHRDIEKLCNDKGISTEGIKKSSFFNKIKEAKNLMDFDVNR
ncbi:hypothetical protein AIA23_01925 [Salmonella enterica subsp. enterica serovar Rubislaw]|nr:hypothetical protein [Salmonella enterica subsp. enterica serovar Rubislaw]